MSKILILRLGGEDRTIDMGKWKFHAYLQELTGKDPLAAQKLDTMASQLEYMTNVIYAGMRTDAFANDQPFDISRETVDKWLGMLEEKEIGELLTKYLEAQKVEAGEVQPQAANS